MTKSETTEKRIAQRFSDLSKEASVKIDMVTGGTARGPQAAFPADQARAIAIAQAVMESAMIRVLAEEVERLQAIVLPPPEPSLLGGGE
jgi:hypothetical protein